MSGDSKLLAGPSLGKAASSWVRNSTSLNAGLLEMTAGSEAESPQLFLKAGQGSSRSSLDTQDFWVLFPALALTHGMTLGEILRARAFLRGQKAPLKT